RHTRFSRDWSSDVCSSDLNTYAITLRQAYVSWNNWLAGQTRSNFQDTAALPEAVDFVGVTDGTTFVRQAQLRYTSGPWSFSIERSEERRVGKGCMCA